MVAKIPQVGERLFLLTEYDETTDTVNHTNYTEASWAQDVYPQMLATKLAEYGQEWIDNNPVYEICLGEWIELAQAWQLI